MDGPFKGYPLHYSFVSPNIDEEKTLVNNIIQGGLVLVKIDLTILR